MHLHIRSFGIFSIPFFDCKIYSFFNRKIYSFFNCENSFFLSLQDQGKGDMTAFVEIVFDTTSRRFPMVCFTCFKGRNSPSIKEEEKEKIFLPKSEGILPSRDSPCVCVCVCVSLSECFRLTRMKYLFDAASD